MMSKPVEVEILQNAVNAPVVRILGRAFPGIIVQGDTLNSPYGKACDVISMKRNVQGTEKLKSALGNWAASDLAYIERLELHANDDGSEVTIVGLFQRRDSGPWPNVDGPMRRVTLRFGGVKSLRLEGFGESHTQIMGFDIRSVEDGNCEDVAFEVEDYEDGRIGFTCSWAEVADVEDTDTFLP